MNKRGKIKREEKKKTESLDHDERIEMDKEMNIQLNRLEEQDDNNNPERERICRSWCD